MAENDSADTNEAGGTLRAKLEAALAEKRELESQLVPLKAAQVIGSKGYKYVTADDLKDVSLTEIEAKAATLEAQKEAMRLDVVKQILAEQGVDEASLESAAKRFIGAEKSETNADVSTRLAGLSRIGGEIPESDVERGKTGVARIEAALQEKYSKKPR